MFGFKVTFFVVLLTLMLPRLVELVAQDTGMTVNGCTSPSEICLNNSTTYDNETRLFYCDMCVTVCNGSASYSLALACKNITAKLRKSVCRMKLKDCKDNPDVTACDNCKYHCNVAKMQRKVEKCLRLRAKAVCHSRARECTRDSLITPLANSTNSWQDTLYSCLDCESRCNVSRSLRAVAAMCAANSECNKVIENCERNGICDSRTCDRHCAHVPSWLQVCIGKGKAVCRSTAQECATIAAGGNSMWRETLNTCTKCETSCRANGEAEVAARCRASSVCPRTVDKCNKNGVCDNCSKDCIDMPRWLHICNTFDCSQKTRQVQASDSPAHIIACAASCQRANMTDNYNYCRKNSSRVCDYARRNCSSRNNRVWNVQSCQFSMDNCGNIDGMCQIYAALCAPETVREDIMSFSGLRSVQQFNRAIVDQFRGFIPGGDIITICTKCQHVCTLPYICSDCARVKYANMLGSAEESCEAAKRDCTESNPSNIEYCNACIQRCNNTSIESLKKCQLEKNKTIECQNEQLFCRVTNWRQRPEIAQEVCDRAATLCQRARLPLKENSCRRISDCAKAEVECIVRNNYTICSNCQGTCLKVRPVVGSVLCRQQQPTICNRCKDSYSINSRSCRLCVNQCLAIIDNFNWNQLWGLPEGTNRATVRNDAISMCRQQIDNSIDCQNEVDFCQRTNWYLVPEITVAVCSVSSEVCRAARLPMKADLCRRIFDCAKAETECVAQKDDETCDNCLQICLNARPFLGSVSCRQQKRTKCIQCRRHLPAADYRSHQFCHSCLNECLSEVDNFDRYSSKHVPDGINRTRVREAADGLCRQ